MDKKKKVIKKRENSPRPRWTTEQIKTLKRLYSSSSNADISVKIGRDVQSIVFKAHRLGLSKSAKRLKEMGKQNIAKRWS